MAIKCVKKKKKVKWLPILLYVQARKFESDNFFSKYYYRNKICGDAYFNAFEHKNIVFRTIS